ncbi:MAG: TPM domain-containing protein [Bacteroidales bacterium]
MQRWVLAGLMLIALLTPGLSQDIPPRPQPPRLVNDMAGILKEPEAARLESMLVQFDRASSTQIAVVTIPDLGGYDISDYAFRLGEAWGVGQEGFDNGFVVLVRPKSAGSRGRVFIATGYGVEEYVPDAVAKRIVETEMIPLFEQNQYFEGIKRGVDILISLTEGKFTAGEYMEQTEGSGAGWGLLVFLIFFIVFILRSRKSRYHTIGSDLPFWAALFLLGSSGRSHSGHFGNFSSGSGGFGGGGGFGGFGGGSFGGGGAGGSW